MFIDDYFLLQKRYPKYIFYGYSALYLLGLTDFVPEFLEVAAPQNYHPSRNKINSLIVHKLSQPGIYSLGIKRAETIFGNPVMVYDEERTICVMIKNREKFDSETFIKGIRFYLEKVNNQTKLFTYAKSLKLEKKVFDVIELFVN